MDHHSMDHIVAEHVLEIEGLKLWILIGSNLQIACDQQSIKAAADALQLIC